MRTTDHTQLQSELKQIRVLSCGLYIYAVLEVYDEHRALFQIKIVVYGLL